MSRRWPKGTRDPGKCHHRWHPVVLETTSRYWREDGTFYDVDQPHLENARVYLVCLKCATHTYMSTAWAGVQLEGSMHRKPGGWESSEYRDVLTNLQKSAER